LSKRYPEPTTEQEAQALQKFLKDGARTQLRTIETVSATVPSGTVTFATPVTIKFERTLEQLVRALAANAERRIRLRIELVDFQGATEGGAALFLNNPSASAQTPEGDPSFLTAVGFFGHAATHPSAKAPRVLEINITRAIRALPATNAAVTVTLVILPFDAGRSTSVRVRAAALQVAEASVKR
jgi:hypothetical protein